MERRWPVRVFSRRGRFVCFTLGKEALCQRRSVSMSSLKSSVSAIRRRSICATRSGSGRGPTHRASMTLRLTGCDATPASKASSALTRSRLNAATTRHNQRTRRRAPLLVPPTRRRAERFVLSRRDRLAARRPVPGAAGIRRSPPAASRARRDPQPTKRCRRSLPLRLLACRDRNGQRRRSGRPFPPNHGICQCRQPANRSRLRRPAPPARGHPASRCAVPATVPFLQRRTGPLRVPAAADAHGQRPGRRSGRVPAVPGRACPAAGSSVSGRGSPPGPAVGALPAFRGSGLRLGAAGGAAECEAICNRWTRPPTRRATSLRLRGPCPSSVARLPRSSAPSSTTPPLTWSGS